VTDKAKYNDVGAIWVKETRKRTSYLSIVITIDGRKLSFAGFANNKAKPNHPDYRIYASKSLDQPKEIPADEAPNTGDDESIPL